MKFRKIISIICALFILSFIISLNVVALTYNVFAYEIIDNEVTITFCSNKFDSIPDEIDGYPVTKIGTEAFVAISIEKNVIIPYSVREIGDHAFLGVIGFGIKDITVPKNVNKIGKCALGYNKIYVLENEQMIAKIERFDDMIIRGYTGTAAETYANENGFTFIALDDLEVTTSVTTSTSTTTGTTVSTTVTTPIETTVSTTTSEPIKILGDANGDGKLNVRDCAYIARMFANGKGGKLPQTADFNGDGIVNVRDASAIARYLALK